MFIYVCLKILKQNTFKYFMCHNTLLHILMIFCLSHLWHFLYNMNETNFIALRLRQYFVIHYLLILNSFIFFFLRKKIIYHKFVNTINNLYKWQKSCFLKSVEFESFLHMFNHLKKINIFITYHFAKQMFFLVSTLSKKTTDFYLI